MPCKYSSRELTIGNGGDGILGLVAAMHSAVSAVLKLPPTRSTHARRQTLGREREGEDVKRKREARDRVALRRRLRYMSHTHTHRDGSRVPAATPPVALLTRRHRGRSRDVACQRGSADTSATSTLDAPLQLIWH